METEYKIIGGDGAEYGPAPLDEIKGWIRDGRVAGSTQVWRSDTSSWLSADRYAELQPDLSHLYASTRRFISQGLRPTGFWARLGGYFIDHFILVIIFAVFWEPIATWQHWQLLPPLVPQVLTESSIHLFLASFALWRNSALLVYGPIFLAYDVLFNGAFGATPGKMAIGAKILMIDGTPIGYWTAFVRWIGARLSDFLLGVGYLVICIRPDKRALHDLIASTKVFTRNDLLTEPPDDVRGRPGFRARSSHQAHRATVPGANPGARRA
jgi:uncharacterized RDD family membrane protein YckC